MVVRPIIYCLEELPHYDDASCNEFFPVNSAVFLAMNYILQ